jgi:hypothetical protein
MRLDTQCGCRAAAGEAGAADVSERDAVAEAARRRAVQDGPGPNFGRATFCRAGFAGHGMAFARSTQRHTLASPFDPRRSLGSLS